MSILSKNKYGQCHLCGDYGKLSYEHVPPKSAFNRNKVLIAGGERIFQGSFDLDKIRGIQLQRGMGGYTLCERCNNNTGRRYGPSYASWIYQAYRYLQISSSATELQLPYWVYPLRVIKQILCMFFSINTNQFHKYYPDLRDFILFTRASGIHPKYRLYAFRNKSGRARFAGLIKKMDYSGSSQFYSEVASPIVGYILTIDSEPPDSELEDLTFMTKYHYNDLAGLYLRIPTKDVYSFMPGDYRSRDQYISDVSCNKFVHVDHPEELE